MISATTRTREGLGLLVLLLPTPALDPIILSPDLNANPLHPHSPDHPYLHQGWGHADLSQYQSTPT